MTPTLLSLYGDAEETAPDSEELGFVGTAIAAGGALVGTIARAIGKRARQKRKIKAAKKSAAARARVMRAAQTSQGAAEKQRQATLLMVALPALALGAFFLLKKR